MKRIALVFAALTVTLYAMSIPARGTDACSDPLHPGGEWPVYGHDLHNTRSQSAEVTISPSNVSTLATDWVFSVAGAGGTGTIESSPMIAGGCVFIATQTGWVFALDAEDGTLMWKTDMGSTVTTLSVADGRVFADVSVPDRPRMVALDADTGLELWNVELIHMTGSDVTGSPVAFGDKVATGISCIGAEGSSGPARLACRGAFVIVDAASGDVIATAFGIPDEDFEDGYSGGGIWSAPAIDLEDGFAYVGAGNPFSAREHPRTNAILKVDIDESRSTFGTVVDSYKANTDLYLPPLGATRPGCAETDHAIALCEFPDLDMASAPNIFEDAHGRKLVGAGQSSGLFHAARASTMEYVWATMTGPPTLGTRSGGAAYDGERLFVNGGPGVVWGLEKNFGDRTWLTPTLGSNTHTAQAHANGVVYTATGNGFPVSALLALDASTGQLLHMHPFASDIGSVAQSVQAGGPVVAHNRIFSPVNGTEGFIVALDLAA